MKNKILLPMIAWHSSLRIKSCINSQPRKIEMIQTIRKTSIDYLEILHRKRRASSNVTIVKSKLIKLVKTIMMQQTELDGWWHLIRNHCWSSLKLKVKKVFYFGERHGIGIIWLFKGEFMWSFGFVCLLAISGI